MIKESKLLNIEFNDFWHIGVSREAAENVMNKIENIRNVILENKDIIRPIEIFLFGSVARNDYNIESDIDIAIVTYTPRREFLNIIYDDIMTEDDCIDVDVVVIPPEYVKSDNVFYKIIEKEKKILWKE